MPLASKRSISPLTLNFCPFWHSTIEMIFHNKIQVFNFGLNLTVQAIVIEDPKIKAISIYDFA